MCRVDAVADALHVNTARGHRFVDLDQLFNALTNAVAATRGVLKHQEGALLVARNGVENLLHRFSDALDPRVDAGATV